MISVIVPIYNTRQYLKSCLTSILDQTYREFELILVDDGSSDGSEAICDEYSLVDSRIRVFHIDNGGVTKAREFGVIHSKGDFVVFVDSDDTIDKHYLECMHNKINDDVDLVVLGGEESLTVDVNEWLSKILSFRCWSSCSKLYRRTLLTNSVFSTDREIKVAEDFLMQLKICANISNSIVITTEKLYCYNVDNPMSAMHSYVRSKEYEEKILYNVASIMKTMPDHIDYKSSYFRYRCHMLGGMIGFKYEVSPNDLWIKTLKEDSINMKLSIRQRIVLSAPNNRMCRMMFVFEKQTRNLINILIKRCTRIIKL